MCLLSKEDKVGYRSDPHNSLQATRVGVYTDDSTCLPTHDEEWERNRMNWTTLGLNCRAAIVCAYTFSLSLGLIESQTRGDDQIAGQKWALLIGVNDYVQLRDLKYCQRDAEALRDRLVEAGFPQENVFLLVSGADKAEHQPIKANIERQLKVVLGLAEAGDMVLVSFSGHGMHPSGQTYLCPTEADETNPTGTMIALNFFYDQLSRCAATQKMFWVDACRNDPRRSGGRSVNTKELSGITKDLASPPEGLLVLASCKEGQISWEDDKFQHGVFMHYLLEGLTGKADRELGDRNDLVSLLELYKYANINTKRTVASRWRKLQTPELFGRITGDFDLADVLAAPVHASWPFDADEATRRQRETAEVLGQAVDSTNSIGMRFKLVPSGEFNMGSRAGEEDRDNDEQQHRVRITKPFYLGVTEVTQGQWEAVMGTRPWSEESYVMEGSDNAAGYVSFWDALEFCSKLSAKERVRYRLPTEAEWEYACRGGTATAYHFGDVYPHRLGRNKPNPFGLYNMHGNMWEWCQDWYQSDYYPNSPAEDPAGPSAGLHRVYRGGGWYDSVRRCRSASRCGHSPDGRSTYLGFRVARTLSGG